LTQPTVGVAIITYRARDMLAGCLAPLLRSPLEPRILVVNSSSNDGTVETARRLGAETMVVSRAGFNHGATREAARRRLATDIVVMMTPDAHARDETFLERLVRPLVTGEAAVAYARQEAREGAGPLERFARAFNYPATSQLRGLADWPVYGSYTHFCSNSCAAWRTDALDRIGGFASTLVSEETIATARLLEIGERIAYVAEARVVHSHPTSLTGDFKRQYDIGYARAASRDLLLAREADERRGAAYLRGLIRTLAAEKPSLLPYALLHTGLRWIGYRMGMAGRRLPVAVNARLSSQDFFWRGDAMVRSGAARA